MGLSDDDFLAESDKDYTKADLGEAEKIKEELKHELGAQKAAQVRETELKSHVDLGKLKEDLAGKNDEETKRKEEEEQHAKQTSDAPKTKSLKQQEESELETAQKQQSTDQLIQKEQQEKEVSDEETQAQAG